MTSPGSIISYRPNVAGFRRLWLLRGSADCGYARLNYHDCFMTVDIDANLTAFLRYRTPEARYASFDYCFNHFQEARESGDTAKLADHDHRMLSCLQLGFYLASWGMMRGSGDLLQRSVRDLVPVVEMIAAEPAPTWDLDAHCLGSRTDEVLALSRRVRRAFTVPASDTLVTKTMLGAFGCVPAFDRYFRIGFGCQTLCADALVRIGDFYMDHQAKIEEYRVFTLNFGSGLDTKRRYSRAKIIDMIFFQEGVNRERHHESVLDRKERQLPG